MAKFYPQTPVVTNWSWSSKWITSHEPFSLVNLLIFLVKINLKVAMLKARTTFMSWNLTHSLNVQNRTFKLIKTSEKDWMSTPLYIFLDLPKHSPLLFVTYIFEEGTEQNACPWEIVLRDTHVWQHLSWSGHPDDLFVRCVSGPCDALVSKSETDSSCREFVLNLLMKCKNLFQITTLSLFTSSSALVVKVSKLKCDVPFSREVVFPPLPISVLSLSRDESGKTDIPGTITNICSIWSTNLSILLLLNLIFTPKICCLLFREVRKI